MKRRKLSFLVLFVALVSMLAMPLTADAAVKTVTLKSTKKTQSTSVYENGKFTLKLSGLKAGTKVTWASSKKSVATVSKTKTTVAKNKKTTSITVNAKKAGKAVISATFTDAKKKKQVWKCTVTVKAKAKPAQESSITITTKGNIILNGEEDSFDLSKFIKKTPKDLAVTYASSDTAVATVSDAGIVKGVKNGKSIITVSSKDGASDSVLAIVTDIEEKDPKVIKLNKDNFDTYFERVLVPEYRFKIYGAADEYKYSEHFNTYEEAEAFIEKNKDNWFSYNGPYERYDYEKDTEYYDVGYYEWKKLEKPEFTSLRLDYTYALRPGFENKFDLSKSMVRFSLCYTGATHDMTIDPDKMTYSAEKVGRESSRSDSGMCTELEYKSGPVDPDDVHSDIVKYPSDKNLFGFVFTDVSISEYYDDGDWTWHKDGSTYKATPWLPVRDMVYDVVGTLVAR